MKDDSITLQYDLEIKNQAKEIKELRDEINKKNIELKKQYDELKNQLKELQHQNDEIDRLRQRVQYMLNQRYGKKSEKLMNGQLDLFDEADLAQDVSLDEIKKADEEITIAAHTRKPSGKRPLPAALPREQIVHDLSEEEKKCSCGHDLHRIGEDISEKLELIPAQIKVIQHVRCKYACRACEGGVKMATLPLQPIQKSIASPGLLSHILISKYADHLPLYRQEGILQRMRIDLGRSTLCFWVLRCAELMRPLVHLLTNMIREGSYVQADETFLQVLNEPNKPNHSKSYMWVYRGGLSKEKAVVYEYQPSRAGIAAENFLMDFEGVLQTDAYSGYNGFNGLSYIEKVIRAGCWAHARRKFMDIVKVVKGHGKAHEALRFIRKLYVIEKEARENYLNFKERQILRQQHAVPILKELKQWLDETLLHVPPQSPIGKAIAYTLNQWPMLMVYVDQGEIEIDNNLVENAIRPFALGRRNWMFSGSDKGARAGAVIYSLLATCKIHTIEPYAYFKYILDQLPCCKTDEQYKELLPQFVDSQKLMQAYSQSTWNS